MAKDFNHIDEEKLLALYYKTNNQEWLGILLERYTLLLLGVCLKYLKQKEKAEDAVQQVFLKTLSAASNTRIRNMGAWLYQVARNECYSQLREQNSKPTNEIIDSILSEDAFSVKNWAAEEKNFKQLEIALSDLSENQRNCITLFYLKEKSYKEVADLLRMNIHDVKSHIQNGKRNLKNKLSQTPDYPEKGGQHE